MALAMRTRGVMGSTGAAILWGGLIAGALDITAAAVNTKIHGGQPMRMLQGIAYALIGASAFKGGSATAALGLLCHFVIAFGAAAAYVLVSRRLSVMLREPVVCGLLYGVPVYLVTNYVIVPLSKIGHLLPTPPQQMAISLVVLMMGVGLPIALMTRRWVGLGDDELAPKVENSPTATHTRGRGILKI